MAPTRHGIQYDAEQALRAAARRGCRRRLKLELDRAALHGAA